MKIFSGSSNEPLAKAICNYIGIGLGESTIKPFPDGETFVKIEENVRGEDVFLVGFRWSRFTPPERIRDFLMLRAAEVALDHGAPYFMVLGQEKELRTDPLHGTIATKAAPQPPPRRPPPSDPGQAATLGESQTMALRIRLVYEKPASGPPVMDAAKLRAELRAEYDLGP